ncbi:MAG: hypothetical protein MJ094_00650 [Saccharofermentans sp.]|nr:hypothetical protein [Saccharofermentans sp.]
MRKVLLKVLTVMVALFIVGSIVVPNSIVRADGTASVSASGSWDDNDSAYKQFNVSLRGVDTSGGPITFSISFEGAVTRLTSYWGCDSCSFNGSSVTITISGSNLYNSGIGFIVAYPKGGLCNIARGSSNISFSQSAGGTPTPTNTPTPTPTNTPTPTQSSSSNPGVPENPGTPVTPDNPVQPQDPVVVPVNPNPEVQVVVEVQPEVATEATQAAEAEMVPSAEQTQVNNNNSSTNNTQATAEETVEETVETTVPIVIIDVNGNEIIVTPTPTPTPVPRYISMLVDSNSDENKTIRNIINAVVIAAILLARLVALKIQGARGADYLIDFIPFGIVRGIIDNVQYSQEKRRRMKEPEKNNGYMEREHNHVNSSASAAEAAKAAQEARAEFARAAAERKAAQEVAAKSNANVNSVAPKAPVKTPERTSANNATRYRPSPLKRPDNN